MTPKLLSVNDLAEALSVPTSWVYSRTRIKGDGQIPNIRCGKYVRFDIDNAKEKGHKNGSGISKILG
jgi:hypothetical protein